MKNSKKKLSSKTKLPKQLPGKKRQTRLKKIVEEPELTQEQILSCISYIVDYLAPGFTFYPHDLEDVKQEARMYGLKAIKQFDPNFKKIGTLEDKLKSFLFRHIKRRLINFKRDKQGRTVGKINLNYAGSIYNMQDSNESKILIEDDLDQIDAKVIQAMVLEQLEPEYRHNFHKMIAGITIPKVQREKMLNRIREIIGAKKLQAEE